MPTIPIQIKIQTIEIYYQLRYNMEFSDYAFNRLSLESWYCEAKMWMGICGYWVVEIR